MPEGCIYSWSFTAQVQQPAGQATFSLLINNTIHKLKCPISHVYVRISSTLFQDNRTGTTYAYVEMIRKTCRHHRELSLGVQFHKFQSETSIKDKFQLTQS
jgi:hypothetical protein